MTGLAPVNLAVFASGTGSNLQRLLDLSRLDELGGGKVVLVVSDKPGCRALERAEAAGVATFAFYPKAYPDKPAYEREILDRLREHRIDWIVLAGYMRLVGEVLLQAYGGRIINLHPSLLPNFPGKDAIGQALAAGVSRTGVTVHFVDEGMDTGPAIAQEAVPVDPGDDTDSLAVKIHAVEHRLLPEVVRALCRGEVWLENGQVHWRPQASGGRGICGAGVPGRQDQERSRRECAGH
ncbi:phosphoribosylglycinamide formyltransferase [Kyrpidia spormannii]|uniref:phosphoribosylglycinamide formyltransferase n=1 Tax=Kyrpidia spormannii TaxID=2055160 RepID=UPI001E599838|nr:phosphoribosylglycinamide formyltransferase [Kyrpidia spormannii]